nr:predicted GPI-anchored protein 58 [Aegilops tauschii subsp. strangulata]
MPAAAIVAALLLPWELSSSCLGVMSKSCVCYVYIDSGEQLVQGIPTAPGSSHSPSLPRYRHRRNSPVPAAPGTSEPPCAPPPPRSPSALFAAHARPFPCRYLLLWHRCRSCRRCLQKLLLAPLLPATPLHTPRSPPPIAAPYDMAECPLTRTPGLSGAPAPRRACPAPWPRSASLASRCASRR